MSSQPEDGWHGGSGSGDGQAPPAGNAAGDAAFPNPTEPIQGAEGVLPATAPAQRTPGAVGPLHGQAPPAGDAASEAAFPTTVEPSQGAKGVLPATAPTQRTPGAVGPRATCLSHILL